MANQNAKNYFIGMKFCTRGFLRSPFFCVILKYARILPHKVGNFCNTDQPPNTAAVGLVEK